MSQATHRRLLAALADPRFCPKLRGMLPRVPFEQQRYKVAAALEARWHTRGAAAARVGGGKNRRREEEGGCLSWGVGCSGSGKGDEGIETEWWGMAWLIYVDWMRSE